MGTDVKGSAAKTPPAKGAAAEGTPQLTGRARRVARGAVTRTTLLTAARELFGTRGFAETSLDDVVARARVTKGALYHHFGSKEGLFAAVYEQVQHEVSDRVVEVFLLPDPWQALVVGCELWIDAHVEPSVQRIVLRDARAVLGWQAVRDVENKFGVVPVRGVLRRAVRAGLVQPLPLRPLALMVMGGLTEACFYVADADDSQAAREEVRALLAMLLEGVAVREGGSRG
jgi:AcrR family transcriptional regulator